MYRAYENPSSLEEMLNELKDEYRARLEAGESIDDLIDLQCEIAELEDRINFAWQDDEEEYG